MFAIAPFISKVIKFINVILDTSLHLLQIFKVLYNYINKLFTLGSKFYKSIYDLLDFKNIFWH